MEGFSKTFLASDKDVLWIYLCFARKRIHAKRLAVSRAVNQMDVQKVQEGVASRQHSMKLSSKRSSKTKTSIAGAGRKATPNRVRGAELKRPTTQQHVSGASSNDDDPSFTSPDKER